MRRALSEDVGSGDITAELIPADARTSARLISREAAVLCGAAWFNETFLQLDGAANIDWDASDGDEIGPDQGLCVLQGRTRALLTGERTALNFLQVLSGTATTTRRFATLLEGYHTKLLDTRKTIPGLRSAQKYAVACGGGHNHRMGLYDSILIKENHIAAAGGVAAAIEAARSRRRQVEVEVENVDQLVEAMEAGAERVLLDNFRLDDIKRAVHVAGGRIRIEVSGGVEADQLTEIAATGVDYISMGALTKHVRAVDFSMRFVQK